MKLIVIYFRVNLIEVEKEINQEKDEKRKTINYLNFDSDREIVASSDSENDNIKNNPISTTKKSVNKSGLKSISKSNNSEIKSKKVNKNITIFDSSDEDEIPETNNPKKQKQIINKMNSEENKMKIRNDENSFLNKKRTNLNYEDNLDKNSQKLNSSEQINKSKNEFNSFYSSNEKSRNREESYNNNLPNFSKFSFHSEEKKNSNSSYNKNVNYKKNYNIKESHKNYSKYNNSNNYYIQEAEKIDIERINKDYSIVPSDKLENLEYLRQFYPKLLERGCKIIFRIYELCFESGGPAASKYKTGIVDEYFEDSKCLLIRLNNNLESNDELINLYGNAEDENESNIISVSLKDFIELRIHNSFHSVKNEIPNEEEKVLENEKEKDNNFNNLNNLKNLESNDDNKKEEIMNNVKLENSKIENLNEENKIEISEISNSKVENSQPIIINTGKKQPPSNTKVNIFNKIVLPHIKRQVEFYFSDKNYYKDSFLLEKAALDFNNFIDLEIVMGFNKIRALTTNCKDIVSALKDSNVVEFDESLTMIRKKNINSILINK